MLRDPCAHLAALAARHGDCFVYPFGGMAETLVVLRPAIALQVLKDADSFGKSDIQTRHMQDFLGPGLLTMAGDPWRRQRRLISGGFRADRIAPMAAPLQVDIAHGLDRLERDAAAGPVDVSAAMMRLAFAAVARSLLGAEVAADDIERISDAITAVQAYLVRQIVLPWAAPLFRVSGDHGRHQALRREGDAIVAAVVDARLHRGARAADAPDADMLDRLLGADDPVSGAPMTRDAVVAEIMQLLVAGHETSSTVLAWTLWLLARHPDALAALRDELAGDHGDAADAVHRLPLMVATLKEAMRLYPPFWLIDRLALVDTVIDGVAIAAGTRIALFVHGLHHRADFWDAPGQFRPERFLGEARANERNGAFLPFGSGPRTCVGSNYAWLQMVTILSAMITRFDLRARDADVPPEALLILRARGGVWLHLAPRA
jgi:cytochrome P450